MGLLNFNTRCHNVFNNARFKAGKALCRLCILNNRNDDDWLNLSFYSHKLHCKFVFSLKGIYSRIITEDYSD